MIVTSRHNYESLKSLEFSVGDGSSPDVICREVDESDIGESANLSLNDNGYFIVDDLTTDHGVASVTFDPPLPADVVFKGYDWDTTVEDPTEVTLYHPDGSTTHISEVTESEGTFIVTLHKDVSGALFEPGRDDTEDRRDSTKGKFTVCENEEPTPTPTSTSTPEPTPTPELTPTSTSTPEPTPTPELTPTSTSTPEPTPTPELTPTSTSTPEPTPTPELTPTSTSTPEPTPTPEPSPTSTSTPEPTPTPEPSPTNIPPIYNPPVEVTPTPVNTPTPTPTATETQPDEVLAFSGNNEDLTDMGTTIGLAGILAGAVFVIWSRRRYQEYKARRAF